MFKTGQASTRPVTEPARRNGAVSVRAKPVASKAPQRMKTPGKLVEATASENDWASF